MHRRVMVSLFGAAALLVSSFTSTAEAGTRDVIVGPGGGLTFSPKDIIIQVGDTVRWTWASDGHNVGSGVHGAPTPYFLSGPPDVTGTVFTFTFDQAFLSANPEPGNLYDYHCHPHGAAGMAGSVTVSAAGIPTMSEWGLLLLAALIMGAGVLLVLRRS